MIKYCQLPEFVTRGDFLRFLSVEHVARAKTAAMAPRRADGDGYIDLEPLGLGTAQTLRSSKPPVEHLLTRRAVDEDTWSRMLAPVAASKQRATTEPLPTARP